MGADSVAGQLRGDLKKMPLQWRNSIWQSLEEGAGKWCSECDRVWDRQRQTHRGRDRQTNRERWRANERTKYFIQLGHSPYWSGDCTGLLHNYAKMFAMDLSLCSCLVLFFFFFFFTLSLTPSMFVQRERDRDRQTDRQNSNSKTSKKIQSKPV